VTASIPKPVVGAATVLIDMPTMTLFVRPRDDADPEVRRLWLQAHRELANDPGGIRSALPSVYASAPGRHHVARGEAVPGGSLAFRFGRGDGFGELVGKPSLRAWVGLDRGTGRILSVTFRHGR
jgi:hypothetical protein